MEFGYSLIPLADEGNGGNFIDRVVMFRKQMALDMGFVIPSVRIRTADSSIPTSTASSLKGGSGQEIYSWTIIWPCLPARMQTMCLE